MAVVVSIRGGSVVEGSSGAPQIQFVVTLSEVAAQTIDVSYRTLNGAGTALSNTDYLNEESFIRFLPGVTSQIITIEVQEVDTLDEADESVVVELFNVTAGGVLAGGAPTLRSTGWILDDDGAGSTLALYVSNPQVTEDDSGQKLAIFTLRLSRAPTSDITLNFTTVDSSAIAGSDYQATAGSVTFLAGTTEAVVNVPVFGDTGLEVSETFSLVVTPTGDIINGTQGATGEATILDDDAGAVPVVSLSAGTVVESSSGAPQLIFVVTLSEPAGGTIDVSYRTLTAASTAFGSNIDYVDEASFVRFFAGQTSQTITIEIQDLDTLDEADEAVVVEIFNTTSGAVLAGGVSNLRATGWILDDDGVGSNLALFVSSPEISEGDSGQKFAVFDVSLSRPAATDITLNYTTRDGSALAGQDYEQTSGSITFLAGQTIAAVNVPVFGDNAIEVTETLSLVVTPTGDIANGTQGAKGGATILDDDAGIVPVVSLTGGGTVTESSTGAPQLHFVVTLSEPAAQTVDVSYRTLNGSGTAYGGNVDYVEEASFVRFFAGQTSQLITVEIQDVDTLDETDEAIVVEIFNATTGAVLAGGLSTVRAGGWILDDDGAGSNLALFVSSPDIREGDSGQKFAVFDVSLSRPAASDITLNYTTIDGSATAGSDYQAMSGSLTFLAGQTIAAVNVPVFGDTELEVSEGFSLVVTPTGDIANGTQGATGEATILDDDAGSVPVVSLRGGATIVESSSGVPLLQFVVTMSQPVAQTVDVSFRTLNGVGTAYGGNVDYVEGASFVRFFAGQTSQLINVQIQELDTLDEADEAVVVEIFNPTAGAVLAGGQSTVRASGWILDDDGADSNLALYVSNPQISEGDTAQKFAVFDISLSRPAAADITLSYTTRDGSATAGEDYHAVSGSITFLAGQTKTAVSVPVSGDTTLEATEGFSLLVTPTAAIANGVAGAAGEATILDDDAGAVPVVSLTGRGTIVESSSGVPLLQFVVTLSEPATQTVDVSYRTLNGAGSASGTGNVDYVDQSSFVRFFAGQTSQIITIQVQEVDTTDETDETIIVEVYATTAGAVLAGGASNLRASGWILDDDGAANDLALFASSPQIKEGDAGQKFAAFELSLSRPTGGDITVNYATADGTAIAGEDYEASSGSVTFLAGQTSAVVNVAILGDGDIEPTESFSLAISGAGLGAAATATLVNDDAQNPPHAEPDAYQAVSGQTLNVSLLTGVLSNDTDVEGNSLTAFLATAPAHGTLSLHADGSFSYTPQAGFSGVDQFTYRASDGTALGNVAPVSITVIGGGGDFEASLSVPNSLAPGEAGTAQLSYTNITSSSLPGALIQVSAKGGLIADPLSGDFASSVFLIGLGDGVGPITGSESGVSDFTVKMGSAPGGTAAISASFYDPAGLIDWTANEALLRPAFVSNAAWTRIFNNLKASAGNSVASLTTVLVQDANFLNSFGMSGESASAALSFELEQAADFGSIAERTSSGSLGDGWSFLGDIDLDVASSGNVILRGSTLLDQLFSLKAQDSAYYTVSNSVGVAASLGGSLLTAAPQPHPTFIKQFDGSYTSLGFDGVLSKTAQGYMIERANGDVLRFDGSGRFVKATALNGLETVANYSAGRIVGFDGPANRSMDFVRDVDGKVLSVTDADGSSVALTYSGDGTHLMSASGGTGSASFSYNGLGDLTVISPPGGPNTAFDYDGAGRLAGISAASGAETLIITYDSLGGYTLSDGAGHSSSVGLLPGGIAGRFAGPDGSPTSLLFDTHGKLLGLAGPEGVSLLTSDGAGRINSITDPAGSTLNFAYGNEFNSPISFTDANGSVRQFQYDTGGQLVEAIWHDGTSLQFDYDVQGNLEAFTNRRGQLASYDYDANGRLVSDSVTSAGPASYTYDDAGRLLAAITPEGTTQLDYDSAGRLTHIEYPNGRSLSYTYDDAGRRTSMTDQDGHAQLYAYDSVGRLFTLSDSSGVLVTYSYDLGGRLISEENRNGTETSYHYDAWGRLSEIINLDAIGGENSRYSYTYNEAGQRIGAVTSDGTWTYGYDQAGQLISATFASTNTAIASTSIGYEYDAAGNRIKSTDKGIETNYVVNALNQYESADGTTFQYDNDGNLTTKIETSGTTNYAYDLNNRLVLVTHSSGDVTSYEYDVFGHRSAVVHNGARTEFLTDPFGTGQVVAEYAADGTVEASYAYGLGLAGRIAADGSVTFYDVDATGSVVGLTDASGAMANAYVYAPFGSELFEVETITNSFEFNGLLGVSEDDNGLLFMRARSYDTELGRFLSEDPIWSSGDFANLYRFANNDPVDGADPSGMFYPSGTNIVPPEALAPLYVPPDVIDRWNQQQQQYAQQQAENFKNIVFGIGNILIGEARFVGASLALYTGNGLFGLVTRSFWNHHAFDLFFMAGVVGGASQIHTGVGQLLDGTGISDALEKLLVEHLLKDDVPADGASSGTSWGDPHLITFDNAHFDFQAAGEFILARGIDENVEIQVRQEPWGASKYVSVNTAVAMRVGDDKIGLYIGEPSPLNINGEFVEIAIGETIAIGGGSVYRATGGSYVVTNEHGDGFSALDRGSYITVKAFLNETRGDDVEGLLGNNDGDPSNDIATADGTVLTGRVAAQDLYGPFADSWRVTPDTTLFVYGPGESTDTFNDLSFPAGVIRLEDLDPAVRAAAEDIARAAGIPEGTIEFDAAVLDVALTGLDDFAAAAAETLPEPGTPQPVVLEVSNPPEAASDEVETLEDQTVFIDPLSNDTDPEDEALTIVDAEDSAGGSITLSGGGIEFTPAPNFSGVTTLSYTIADTAGNEVEGTIEVTVTPVNDAPTDVGLSASTVEEHAANGTIVGSLSRADADIPYGDTAVYSLTDDAGGRFGIVGATVVVADGSLLDYEDGTSHSVTIRITDAAGEFRDETFVIDVTDRNDNSPAFDSGAAASIAENVSTAAVIYDAEAHDDDGTPANSTIAYSLSPGGDNALFSIDGATGEVRFLISPDYEVPGDAGANNVYDITIHALDGEHDTTLDVAITVTDVNEGGGGPVHIIDDSSTHSLSGTAFNDTLEGNAGDDTLTGEDGGDLLVGGADNDSIDGGGGDDTAAFSGAWADYSVTDVGPFTIGDNRIDAPDGTDRVVDVEFFQFSDVIVSAADLPNDAPTDISLSASVVEENAANGTVVATLSRTDLDIGLGDTAVYSLTDDAGGRFGIVGDTLVVADGSLLDYEDGTDHAVTFRVTDAHDAFYDETFVIDVTDRNDNAPAFDSGAAASVAENISTATVIYDADAHDDDATTANSTIVYSLSPGSDNVLFSIDGVTGAVRFLASPDYEAPADASGDNVYNITVHVFDSEHDTTLDVAITVTDVNEGGGVIIVDNGSSHILSGTPENDTIVGNGGRDTLHGLGGNDILDGGLGADLMSGGDGNDTYFINHVSDSVNEAFGEGVDSVMVAISPYTLGADVENLVYIGAGRFKGFGNDLDNMLTGGGSRDTLDGAGGADTMNGGAGDDLYFVDDLDDLVNESASEGIDTIVTALDAYTLGSHVENLTYTGVGAFAGNGNGEANLIRGGAANDTLDGLAGADRMVGGLGDDVYYADDSGDFVKEFANGGVDTVLATAASYTLSGQVENLIFTDGANHSGAGHSGANLLSGNSGNDTLSGLGGRDTIIGGGGDDSISGGLGKDAIDGGAGADTLEGGGAADVFVFRKGEADGDVVADFTRSGDIIQLVGYGAGAMLTSGGVAGDWIVSDGGSSETIHLTNEPGTLIENTHYFFV